MIDVRAMRPCPHCGVLLTWSLVDAVADKKADEACPRAAA